MCQTREKRPLTPSGMVEAFHGEELTVDGVVRLVHHRAHRRHLRVFEYRIPARFFVLEPVANTLATGLLPPPCRCDWRSGAAAGPRPPRAGSCAGDTDAAGRETSSGTPCGWAPTNQSVCSG